jgi:hypothetical protein
LKIDPRLLLRVVRVLNLDPRRSAVNRLVRALREFGDDAFHVTFAHLGEHCFAVLLDVIDIQHSLGSLPDDPTKASLTLEQRLVAKIGAFEPKQIERGEYRTTRERINS